MAVVRKPRFHRVPPSTSPHVTVSRHKLLAAIGRYGILSEPQLRRLLYGNSRSWVTDELRQLYDHEYLDRIPLRLSDTGGSAQALHVIDNRGYAYLRDAGLVLSSRFRKVAASSVLHLRHTTGANDLVILCHLLSKAQPQFRVASFETDADLKRHPVYVGVDGGRIGVVPDGWINLQSEEADHFICWEYDRATEDQRVFREKIAGLVHYSQGPYQQEFGANSLVVAFVTEDLSDSRLPNMLAWTEAEMARLRAKSLAGLFLFASFDPATADAEHVFLSPIWRSPFSDELHTLLEG